MLHLVALSLSDLMGCLVQSGDSQPILDEEYLRDQRLAKEISEA